MPSATYRSPVLNIWARPASRKPARSPFTFKQQLSRQRGKSSFLVRDKLFVSWVGPCKKVGAVGPRFWFAGTHICPRMRYVAQFCPFEEKPKRNFTRLNCWKAIDLTEKKARVPTSWMALKIWTFILNPGFFSTVFFFFFIFCNWLECFQKKKNVMPRSWKNLSFFLTFTLSLQFVFKQESLSFFIWIFLPFSVQEGIFLITSYFVLTQQWLKKKKNQKTPGILAATVWELWTLKLGTAENPRRDTSFSPIPCGPLDNQELVQERR